ncbi:maleylpyruvate isomerase family mycothiol-dependent enzyme [Pseudonocardia kunmingensis]|uniref:Maleylpyruvate isomerase n=1 Tax=Pseudonocardia kunmingensis TaxID=630975 RepID=A0A543DN97_9PSEU|nr:maleylpyruvate isomerase family mycothiol-dependent enzyme [Pseudonocardia kunmingensis]TQM10778.1 maleylpyruvate isomerase [Pseudonocardia kunmingensis]
MTPAGTRSLAHTLAWAGDGAAHLRGLMTRMGEEAFAAPSALPGWSRAHVLTHVARNADALINLLTWARTGVRTPAYAGREQRDADIEAGARRTPAMIRDDVVESSDRLARVVRAMPDAAWSAQVQNAQGRDLVATDIPWLRAREMWIHAVDLDVGASFADMPAPMVTELLTDVTATMAQKPDCPALHLVAPDGAEWVVGDPGAARTIRGPAPELAAWLLGRSRGRTLSTADGGKPPTPPRWL